MKQLKAFPFERARRVRADEVRAAKVAIEKKLGIKRLLRGRPPKPVKEKYQTISIRLDPKIITWAKTESKKQGVGYQTLINQVLLKRVA